ncbi:MAG TPA: thermonuclease family protein [Nocardioidaceae bacterium]
MSRVGVALLTVAVVTGVAVALRLVAADPPPSGQQGTGEVSVATGVPDEAERARVVSHVDGDTLHLVSTDDRPEALRPDEDTTVRLLEVDTPEHGRDGQPEECYADEATEALENLVAVGEDVWVLPDRDLLDRYGRTLLYLWTDDGAFVNLEMVRQGYARAVLHEPNDAFIDVMNEAERQARAEGRGMWGSCAVS